MIAMQQIQAGADHKLRVLQHPEKIGDVGKACRYLASV
jgi:hypothetical protein